MMTMRIIKWWFNNCFFCHLEFKLVIWYKQGRSCFECINQHQKGIILDKGSGFFHCIFEVEGYCFSTKLLIHVGETDSRCRIVELVESSRFNFFQELFYATGHTGVLYNFETNSQTLYQGHVNIKFNYFHLVRCDGYLF